MWVTSLLPQRENEKTSVGDFVGFGALHLCWEKVKIKPLLHTGVETDDAVAPFLEVITL